MKFFFIYLFFFCVPLFSQAAVVINEVAWMGTLTSANDEWIELYNNGSQSVDVTGWSLSDGVNLNIDLSGSIDAGGYAVLERTDDNSAPGVMFMSYTGALANTGATLSLYRTDGLLEERVVGGEAWVAVGGNNVTKETAQYTSGGWITAEATPGRHNAQDDTSVLEVEDDDDTSSQDEEDEEDGETKGSDASSKTTLYLNPRTPYSSIVAPARVYVNQEVDLTVQTKGLAEAILRSFTHEWNFGDFTVAVGTEVVHRFLYPGEYVVTLHSHYGEYEAYARKTITVLPVSFSMTTNSSGDIQVHNNAKYEVDLSGYRIVAGKTLVFPPRTILLPNATITIPKEKVKHTGNSTAALFDDTAVLVASMSPTTVVEPQVVQKQTPVYRPVAAAMLQEPISPAVTPQENFSFIGDTTEVMESVDAEQLTETSTTTGVSQVAAPIAAADGIPEGKLPYFALLAVIGLGITAVFVGRVSK